MDTYEGSQTDPLSLHKYVYCADNPVNRIDPLGHEGIEDVLDSIGVIFALGGLPNLAIKNAALASSGTCGPDVTIPVLRTIDDAQRTFLYASPAQKYNAAYNVYNHPYDMLDGWDIDPLFALGHNAASAADFGNRSSLGTGGGKLTVQFGIPPKVYYAGSVNYILWGAMFSMFHEYYRNPLSGAPDSSFSENVAVASVWEAKFNNWLVGQGNPLDQLATEARAFVKCGYSGANPSSSALPLATNPSNVSTPSGGRFNWKWLGLHDTPQ
jgi:hypothetical protein